MGIGKQFRDGQIRYEDPLSGREVTCLTNWLGHSWQFYFTHPCWLDDGRSFLFHSGRDNAGNYFRYELATGDIVQLTDLQGKGAGVRGIWRERGDAQACSQGMVAHPGRQVETVEIELE